MTFTLEYTARALRDLKGLDRQDGRRTTAGLKTLEAQEMPWLHIRKLRTSASSEPVYSFHLGSYRVLIELDFVRRRIVVDEIEPEEDLVSRFLRAGVAIPSPASAGSTPP